MDWAIVEKFGWSALVLAGMGFAFYKILNKMLDAGLEVLKTAQGQVNIAQDAIKETMNSHLQERSKWYEKIESQEAALQKLAEYNRMEHKEIMTMMGAICKNKLHG